MRRTKIVATLGPAVDSLEAMVALLEAGADVFRMNLSHGQREDHERLLLQSREAQARTGRNLAVLIDLQGPRLRVGRMKDGRMQLETGSRVTLTSRDVIGEVGRRERTARVVTLADAAVVGDQDRARLRELGHLQRQPPAARAADSV